MEVGVAEASSSQGACRREMNLRQFSARSWLSWRGRGKYEQYIKHVPI